MSADSRRRAADGQDAHCSRQCHPGLVGRVTAGWVETLMARVLIIESDSFQAFLAALQLEGMGHEIVGVTDSIREAMGMAGKMPPEVAVINLVLQGDMDGVDLGNKLQREHGSKVIYTSGYDFLLNSLKGQPPTLTKPYDPEQLQSAIEEVMQDL